VKHAVIIFLILLNMFLAYKLIWGGQGILAHQELNEQNAALESRLAELASQQQSLSDEIRLLKSDAAHMESIIRRRLNYVKDNEVLYMFPEGFPQTDTSTSGAEANEAKN
jgi:cell division protein FtsB